MDPVPSAQARAVTPTLNLPAALVPCSNFFSCRKQQKNPDFLFYSPDSPCPRYGGCRRPKVRLFCNQGHPPSRL